MKLKTLIPKSLRLHYQLLRRRWRDTLSVLAFAKPASKTNDFPEKVVFRQNILHATTNLGKVENMRLGGSAISKVVIQPNEVLSFWKIVGDPSGKHGFHKSRNLVNGILQEDFGGGLCQVSGIVYYAALSTGLKVLERHAHSVDIYAENERFAPLGGDATVVYGYKDVRIQNTTKTPISFKISVENGQLVCELCSFTPLSIFALNFERTDFSNKKRVTTQRQMTEGGTWENIVASEYKIMA
jgi:vancomycin resistance protein VanW